MWAQLDRAHVIAAPEARLWIAGTAGAAASRRRIKLGKRRNLDLAEHDSVELGSSDSLGTILVPHQLLVVPVEVSLPLLPMWLRGQVGTLRRHSRLGLDQFKEENTVLLSGEDFVNVVTGLARQLDPAPDPEPQPPIFEVARVTTTYPRVIEATHNLRELLMADHVTRFTLADGGVLA